MHTELCLRFTLSDSLPLAVIGNNVSFETSSSSATSAQSLPPPASSTPPLGILPSLVQHLMTTRPRSRANVTLACAICLLPLSLLPHPPTAAALDAACASHVASAAAALVAGFTRAEENACSSLCALALGSTLGNRDAMRAQAAAAAGMKMKVRLLRGDLEGVVLAVANASASNAHHVKTCGELAAAAAAAAAAAVGGAVGSTAVRLDCMMAPLLIYAPIRSFPPCLNTHAFMLFLHSIISTAMLALEFPCPPPAFPLPTPPLPSSATALHHPAERTGAFPP